MRTSGLNNEKCRSLCSPSEILQIGFFLLIVGIVDELAVKSLNARSINPLLECPISRCHRHTLRYH